MSEDVQSIAVLDAVDALEKQIAPLRRAPGRMLRHVLINIAMLFVLGLTFDELGYAFAWLVGLSAATVLVHLPAVRKLQKLNRERDRLLTVADGADGQGSDVL